MAVAKKFSPEFWRAVAWTGWYVFFMWAILFGLFHFNMFSLAHWAKVFYVELHGFAGFVFGILLLAAVPLYIATTVLTVRNKINPVKVLRPRCFDAQPKPEPAKPTPLVVEQDTLPDLPPGVPAEMREVFAIAKKNSAVRQRSVFNRPSTFDDSPIASSVKQSDTDTTTVVEVPVASPVAQSAAPVVVSEPALVEVAGATQPSDSAVPDVKDTVKDFDSPLPIPTDFETPSAQHIDVPVFSEIKFDDDDDDDVDVEIEEPENSTKPEYALIQEFLVGAGHNPEMMGNLIVVDKFAIAVHTDDDFWVADETDWFAAGRQKPSPIVELMNAKNDKKLKPVLYLGTDNIMDFDKVSAQWRDMGIQIVTNTDELSAAITSKPKKKS